ncbi:MAG: homoserine dehydrogenase, partial [Actinomycetota bacterium]|nr:homoserine dehydrogenase [Actinomycetota bacterium]
MTDMTGMKESVGVGILGFGNVGGALVGLISDHAKMISARNGVELRVERVAVRNVSKDRGVALPDGVLTADAAAVVDDPAVDVVVEVI